MESKREYVERHEAESHEREKEGKRKRQATVEKREELSW